MSGMLPPIISFVARSGTGKTTFLQKLLAELGRRSVRVMVVKHDVHGFEVDKPGKDTWKFRQAGARQVLIANAHKMALMASVDGEQPLLTLVSRYARRVDLVITEGYRRSGMPKFLVARKGAPQPFAPGPEELEGAVAALTDYPLQDLAPHIEQLPLNDVGPCADMILERFVRRGHIDRPLTGVVLAGGRSTRMGSDKAFLEVDGKAVLSSLVESILPHCAGGVTVVRRGHDQVMPPLPEGTRVVEDLLPDNAALGGLYTGLALAETPFVFLAACDMPKLNPALVEWLRTLPPKGADVLLPVANDREQPMHAIYGHRCLGAMKEALLSGELAMGRWYGSMRVERIRSDRWREVDPEGASFINVNTQEELARL